MSKSCFCGRECLESNKALQSLRIDQNPQLSQPDPHRFAKTKAFICDLLVYSHYSADLPLVSYGNNSISTAAAIKKLALT